MKMYINVTTFVVLLCILVTMACGCSGKIIDEEQATGESFNARDHLTAEIYG